MKFIEESYRYARDLYDMGRRSFDDLLEEESSCLTGLLMRETRNNARYEFLIESDKSDELISHVMRFLIAIDRNESPEEGCYSANLKERKHELLYSIQNTCASYAKEKIDKIFDSLENEDRYFSNYQNTDTLRVKEVIDDHTRGIFL